jgi:hypothetical protein
VPKGKPLSAETRVKISAALKGKKRGPLSSAAKAKISAALTGRKVSAATKAKLSAAMKGRKLSASTKAKIAAANKGRKVSAATRAKLSTAMKGRKLSAATRAKIAAALRARNASRNRGPSRSAARAKFGRYRPTVRARTNRASSSSLLRVVTRSSVRHNITRQRGLRRRSRIVIRRKVRANRVGRRRRR